MVIVLQCKNRPLEVVKEDPHKNCSQLHVTVTDILCISLFSLALSADGAQTIAEHQNRQYKAGREQTLHLHSDVHSCCFPTYKK